ncbi:MAG: DUF2384 domain-containing protein [Candidatus Rokubacteria bacterium]|nr:DUF2384 domain-containing protein [Candidatus Rokubacteria bacterium]
MTMARALRKKVNLAARLVEGFDALPSPVAEPKEIQGLIDRIGVRQEEFARLIKTSGPSMSRWVRGTSRPSGRMAEKLGRLRTVLDILEPAIEKKDLKHFLERPHTRLRGHSPISLLESDHGLETVKDLIETAFTGAFT